MPVHSDHITLAVHNLDVLHYLIPKENFYDWLVIVACYSSIHLIEAMLSLENGSKARTIHSTSHADRNLVLQNAYPAVWRKFRPLYDASLVARYLIKDDGSASPGFPLCYNRDTVVNKLIKSHFAGVIQRTDTFISPNYDTSNIHDRFSQCLEAFDEQEASPSSSPPLTSTNE